MDSNKYILVNAFRVRRNIKIWYIWEVNQNTQAI